jgi:hypothetical protein
MKIIIPTIENLDDIYSLHKKTVESLKDLKFMILRTKTEIEEIIKDKKSRVIYFENRLIAYSLFKKIDATTLQGRGAIVDKEFRGLGLQILMYKLIKKTTTENIFIRVNKNNTYSIRNITKLGLTLFKEDSENNKQLYRLLRN